MGKTRKARRDFSSKVQAAATIQEIEDLSLQINPNDEDDYYSIRKGLLSRQENLFKEYIENLKPIWLADFFLTHRFELLVYFWSEYRTQESDDLFFNQLKELVQNIDKAHLLEHIFDAVIGDSGCYWCNLLCDLIDDEESTELLSVIKQQVIKIIDSTDSLTLSQDEELKEFIIYFNDQDIIRAYDAKIIQDKS